MLNAIWSYATMPVSDVEACLRVPVPQDSFLAKDATTTALSDLLKHGYRWVRTDGEIAVFEKCVREAHRSNTP